MYTTIDGIQGQKSTFTSYEKSNTSLRRSPSYKAHPQLLVGSALAVLGLIFGLYYVDQMVAQNWLMLPLD